ncbi:MAG: NADH:flavin oxidoreductase [Pseudomonadota bacterium]
MSTLNAFTPIKIGPLTLRNRFVKSATNEGMAKGGIVSRGLARFHERMAEGGVALSTVAYCSTSKDGRTFVDQVTMDDESLPDFRVLTDGVHKHGAAACAQITHAGSFTFLPQDELSTSKPLSSSGGFNKVGVFSRRYFKKAMSVDEMRAVTDEFVKAAHRAQNAGFDAVELHMGHGYLLSQFLSPLYNKRRDDYGGSIEKRLAFPTEVLGRVLDAVGDKLAVIVKYSMTDGVKGGNTIEEGVAVAKALEANGAHMAVLSNGLNVESIQEMFGSSLPKSARSVNNPVIRMGMMLQSMMAPPEKKFSPNYLLDNARQIRSAVNMPLAYLGGIQSKDGFQQALSDGFDCVALGRVLVHDANLINQWRDGLTEASGCTACNRCVSMMYLPEGTHCVLTGPQDAALNTVRAREAA